MAFTVEDGTGIATANAYVSIAYVDEYHDGLGNVGWVGGVDVKQQAIVVATAYVESVYGMRFIGVKKTSSQRLQWPRSGAVDPAGGVYAQDAIPGVLQDVVAEYALRALCLGQQFWPDPAISYPTRDSVGAGSSQTAGAAVLASTKTKVGPIEESYSYTAPSSGGTRSSTRPKYPAIEAMLKPLITSGSVVRA